MAEDLVNSGLRLKQLQVTDYTTLIEDLNYNFSMLLTSPLFRGIQGIPGGTGASTNGVRGSRWYYVDFNSFKAQWPDLYLANLGLAYINSVFTTDLAKLKLALNTTEDFVQGDTLLMPSGAIYYFNATTGVWEDSGAYIQQSNSTVTQNWVINYVTTLMNANQTVIDNNFISFEAVAKYYKDGSAAGVNDSTITSNKVLDPKVSSNASYPGAAVKSHKFIGLKERNPVPINATDYSYTDTVTQIIGSATKYHQLIQSSQGKILIAGDYPTTNDYAPGVDDSAAFAVLQDNLKNGIIFGYKDAPTGIKEFGRLFVSQYKQTDGTKVNAVRLTSNYALIDVDNATKDLSSEFSELVLGKDFFELRALSLARLRVQNLQIFGDTIFSDGTNYKNVTAGNISARNNLDSPSVKSTGKNATVGQDDVASVTSILSDKVVFQRKKSIQLLGTNANGELIDSGIVTTGASVSTTTSNKKRPAILPESSSSKIATSKLVADCLQQILNIIDGVDTDIDSAKSSLSSTIASTAAQLQSNIDATNTQINALITRRFQYGMFSEVFTKCDASNSVARFNSLFDSNGLGLSNARVYTDLSGNYKTINLSGFAFCDGRNGTPDFRGATSVCGAPTSASGQAVSFRNIQIDPGNGAQMYLLIPGATFGDYSHTIGVVHMATHAHSMQANGAHGHGISTAGGHNHGAKVSVDGNHSHTTSTTGDHSHSLSNAGAHVHASSVTDTNGSHNHSISIYADGLHTHTYGRLYLFSRGVDTGGYGYRVDHEGTSTTNPDGNHTHSADIGWSGAHAHNITLQSDGDHSHSMGNAGSHYHTTDAVGSHQHDISWDGDHMHAIAGVGDHTHTINSNGSSTPISITQPSVVTYKIMCII